MMLSKLKPAHKYLTEKNRREVISAKVKPVALYGVQLMLGQNQRILHKAETILMCINRQMTYNPLGLSSSEALCKYIGIDQPIQEILKSNFKLMHKMIKAKEPQSILDQLRFPSRSCGFIQIRDYPVTERSKRSPLFYSLKLYNAISPDIRILPPMRIKSLMKKSNISYN